MIEPPAVRLQRRLRTTRQLLRQEERLDSLTQGVSIGFFGAFS
jgi:hypothetical protein